jgi:phage terminase large subunit
LRITLPNGWQPRAYQRPLWDYLERGGDRAIEIAHRRWGKDDVFLHRTAIAAHERVATYWHCLPEYEQARKAIWAAVNPHTGKRRIDEAFPPEIRESKDEQQMFIRFKNGSTWQVIGSDRYNSLVGAGVAGVTFSEWALCNPSSWGYIRPMMEENNGWAAFITTPRGKNHAKAMLDMARDNPRWFAEVSTIHDTGALTQEQLDESLLEYISLYGEDLGRAQFEQEYLCSFNAAIMGAFYAREMLAVRTEDRIQPVEPIDGRPVHTAWDLGVEDSTAIWWFQVVGAQIFILDYYVAHGYGVDHYAEVVKGKPWPKGIDFVPHDAKVRQWGVPGARTRVESMLELGLHPQLVPMSTDMDGHQAVRKTLPSCVFHPRTEAEGMSALEQYHREWDDDLKTYKLKAQHDWSSHGAKAFQYLSQAWRAAPVVAVEQPKPQPKGTVVLLGPPVAPSKTRIRV